MITEISIHEVVALELASERLGDPAPNCTTVKIKVGAVGVSGELEWQVLTLFCYDKTGQKFEDGIIHRKISAFNSVELEDASRIEP